MTPKQKTVLVRGVPLSWNAEHHRYIGLTDVGEIEIISFLEATNTWRAYWLDVRIAEQVGAGRTAKAATAWLTKAAGALRGVR